MMKNIASDQNDSKLSNVQEKDVQPNAVDLRLDKIFSINDNTFILDEKNKKHRGATLMRPDDLGYYWLEPGTYEVTFQNIITVASGEAGFVITRSTLNRNGVFITSGLYDSGYKGVMASVMHVTTGTMHIAKGTRIGQYLNFQAETLSMYDGDYGIGKEFDKKNYEGK